MRFFRNNRTRVSSGDVPRPMDVAEFLRTVYAQSQFYQGLWGSNPDLSLPNLPITSAATLPSDVAELVTESSAEMDVVASCGTSGRRRIRVRDALGIAAGRSTYLDIITKYCGSKPQRVAKAGIFNNTPRQLEAAFKVQFQCDQVLPLDFAQPVSSATVRDFAPTLVLGSPRALLYLQRKGYLAGSEQLISMNEAIRPWGFTARTFDTGDIYAASEFSGPVTYRCPQSGLYHPAGTLLYIETLPTGVLLGDRSVCRLVITDLANLVSPLVRYDTGDLVLVDGTACTCGEEVVFSHFVGRQPVPSPDEHYGTRLAGTVYELEEALRGPIVWRPRSLHRPDHLEVFSWNPDRAREVVRSGVQVGLCALGSAEVVHRDVGGVIQVPAQKWHPLQLDPDLEP